MANHEYELQLKWENGVSFEMTTKYDNGAVFTVVKMDENQSIAILWPYIDKICRSYFNKITGEIGTEMKS